MWRRERTADFPEGMTEEKSKSKGCVSVKDKNKKAVQWTAFFML